MKIRNTLKTLPNYALPRLLYWVCEELNLPFAGVHAVEFTQTPKVWSGRVIWKERRIVNSINPNAKFPLKLKNKATEKDETIHNELELLVFATAQNLSYLREYWETSLVRAVNQPHVSQASVDKRAFEVLNKFRSIQSDLITRWNTAPTGQLELLESRNVDFYTAQLQGNIGKIEEQRKKLVTLKSEAKKVRDEIHRLHVRNTYCNRHIKRLKAQGDEWTIPTKFVVESPVIAEGGTVLVK